VGLTIFNLLSLLKKAGLLATLPFSRFDVNKGALSPFMLVLISVFFLQLPRRIFFLMLRRVKVGFVGVQFHIDSVSQADPKMARQGGAHFPAIAFYIKVYFAPTVIIDGARGIIPIFMLGAIPVGRGMVGRPFFHNRRVFMA
jgi:hypothetical protein